MPKQEDPEFTAKVDFIQDPEFIALERNLLDRQEKDKKDLEQRQMEQRIALGKQPGVTREQLDDNFDRQLREREAQSKAFKTEHDRHIRQYHNAKAILAEMNEPAREEQLQQPRDDNEPKITR